MHPFFRDGGTQLSTIFRVQNCNSKYLSRKSRIFSEFMSFNDTLVFQENITSEDYLDYYTYWLNRYNIYLHDIVVLPVMKPFKQFSFKHESSFLLVFIAIFDREKKRKEKKTFLFQFLSNRSSQSEVKTKT